MFRVVARWIWLCLGLSAASAVAGLAWLSYAPKQYGVYAEILVRYAFEYTPLDVGRAGDTMQVRIDADTALNSDVQILTSRPLIDAAASATRSKLSDPDAAMDDVIESASRALAVTRIPGTSIIKVTVTHDDRIWAAAFLEDLLSRYEDERWRLFSAEETRAFFSARRDEISRELRALDEQFYEASPRRGVAAEAQDPLQSITLTQELARKRQSLVQSLERINALSERLDLQSALNRKLSFVTPPTVPKRPVGLPSSLKLAMFIFIGFASGVMFALLIEGLRQERKASH